MLYAALYALAKSASTDRKSYIQVGDFLFFFFFFRLGTATFTGVSSNASAFRLFVDGIAVSFRTKQDTKNPFVASSPGEQRMRDVASSARRVD
jgi:hypothetical protein